MDDATVKRIRESRQRGAKPQLVMPNATEAQMMFAYTNN